MLASASAKMPHLLRQLVERVAAVAHRRQLLGRDLQLARGLLDEGAGAAAAGGLHEDLLGRACAVPREEHRLHVLAADLGDESHLGVQLLDRGRDRDHFLDVLAAEQRGGPTRPGAGDEDAIAARRQSVIGLESGQELEHLLGLAGVVALVVRARIWPVRRPRRLARSWSRRRRRRSSRGQRAGGRWRRCRRSLREGRDAWRAQLGAGLRRGARRGLQAEARYAPRPPPTPPGRASSPRSGSSGSARARAPRRRP